MRKGKKDSATKKIGSDHHISNGGVAFVTERAYNPYENRHLEHPNTFYGALMHLLKASMGTGILAIPSTVAAIGIVIGATGIIFVGILCTHTIHLLVFASQNICKKAKLPMLGFSDTAYEVFKHGPKKIQSWANFARLFVDSALLLTYFSLLAVYVVFISENIQQIVNYYHPEVKDWPLRYYMLMLLLPLIICCQIRQLKHLVPFSMGANTTMLIAFVITLYYMFSGIRHIKMENRKLFNDLGLIPLFFSTVLFSMEGIGTALPIENSMIKQQFIGCPGVLNTAMTIVITLYAVIGIFGYIRFGDNVKANVIANLPVEEIPAQVAKCFIAVAVFNTFMLQFYVPCDIIWTKLSPKVLKNYHNYAQIILRILLVLLPFAIAAIVPKLDAIISLVGSVCFSILGLFIPAIIDTILNLSENGSLGIIKWKLWKNIFISILSWFALFSGSYYAIKKLVDDD